MVKVVGRIGFAFVILLALVGIASVVGRFVLVMRFLNAPAVVDTRAADLAPGFNERYYAHPYLTLLHIIPGFFFMTLGPLQFVRAVRTRWLGFHRWCGRIYLGASLVGVLSALAFVPMLPVFGTLPPGRPSSSGPCCFWYRLSKVMFTSAASKSRSTANG